MKRVEKMKYLKDKKEYLKVRIPSKQKEKFIREAAKKKISLSEYIRRKLAD